MTTKLFVGLPTAFSDEERAEFVQLVKKDPQVNENSLSRLVEQAHFLTFLYIEGTLVGTNAIKNNPEYQRKLEARAGVLLSDSDYFGEVGYLHVAETKRGVGLSDVLLVSTFAAVKRKGLFATIQSTNVGSRRLFERYGFWQVGKSWPSTKMKDQVSLYIRPRR